MTEAAKPTARAAEKAAATTEKVVRTPQAVAEDMMEQVSTAMRGPAVQGMFASQQKNLETLLQAQTVLFEGANAVFKRQLEIMQRIADQAVRASGAMMTPGTDPKAGMEKQLDAARQLMEQIVADTQELGTLIGKSQQEAADLLNKRILENLEELRAAFSKAA